MIVWKDVVKQRPVDRERVLVCYDFAGWTNQKEFATYRDGLFQLEGFDYRVKVTYWTELNNPYNAFTQSDNREDAE